MLPSGSTYASSTDAEWRAIAPAERFELLATIREMREWRYGDDWPLKLGPIRRAALELHRWRKKIPAEPHTAAQGWLL